MTHTTERVPLHEAPSPVPPSTQTPQPPPGLSLAEALIAGGLLAAVTLTTLVITSDTDSRRIETEQVPVVRTQPGVPLSADGAERYLAGGSTTRPDGVPWSADSAERYLAGQD